MSEAWIIGTLGIFPVLWMLGGTYLKGFRRIGCAIVGASGVLISGGSWISSILVGGSLAIVNFLPYGDRTPWALKAITLMAIPLPCLLLGIPLIVPLVGGVLMILGLILTKRYNWFTHKVWEGLCGFVQGACLVLAILYCD